MFPTSFLIDFWGAICASKSHLGALKTDVTGESQMSVKNGQGETRCAASKDSGGSYK